VLTGENARYKKSNGSLNGVLPENAAFDSSGQGNGAWQVLLRHSNLDLTEAAGLNNELTVTNLGLNWFVNPHSTILMGISRAELSELDATHMLTVRFGYWF
jgi:phosphate-selective porin